MQHSEKIKMMADNQPTYLIHWLKKGEKAKYIHKEKLANGRYRYFYTQAELDAYKKKLSTSAGEMADKAKQGLQNLSEGAKDLGAEAIVGLSKRSDRVYKLLGGEHKDTANMLQQRASGYWGYRTSAGGYRQSGRSYKPDQRDLDKRTETQQAANKARAEYNNTILGKAEARVKRNDVRKATAETRERLLNAAANGKKKDSNSSIFKPGIQDEMRRRAEEQGGSYKAIRVGRNRRR